MSTAAASTANALHDAAFGAHPGAWPLPPATEPRQCWLRAVAAGGQGRYASALSDLERLRRLPATDDVASLASSTRASFLRQLGWHDHARGWDGRAAALADTGEAAADAFVGLAADALGVGRFAASARALQRAAGALSDTDAPRLPVRVAWVSAELAMFEGEGGQAVGHAERGVHLAEGVGSARHTVKSQVVLAAALCSRGDLQASRRVAVDALDETQRLGLVPLQWAVASLLADIGAGDRSPGQIRGIRDAAAQTVIRWGGVWRRR